MGDNVEPSPKDKDQSEDIKPKGEHIFEIIDVYVRVAKNAWARIRTTFRRPQVQAGLIAGFIVALVTFLTQYAIDDMRASDANRQENLRFIRDKSSTDDLDRPFAGLDVKGLNLRGLQLRDANFQSANLASTDLSLTDLSGANLMDARLNNARLNSTDLSGANLAIAHLHGADLAFSDLSNAVLWEASGAILDGLRGVNLAGTDLRGADIREMRGIWGVELRDHAAIDLLVAAANGDYQARRVIEFRAIAGLDGGDLDWKPRRILNFSTEERDPSQPDFASLPDYPEHATACFDSSTKWPDYFDPPPMWPDACLIHDAVEDVSEEN